MDEIMDDLETLWDYLSVGTDPVKSDCVIGLGSILALTPIRCAELYHQGYADYIVFSGNCGKGTEGVLSVSEADRFKEIALGLEVPEDAIITESKALTTYDNFRFINGALQSRGLNPHKIMLVSKPYHGRRARAIADVYLKGKEYSVASMNMTLQDYLDYVEKDELMKVSDVVDEMVGEISLIIKAPQYGIQSSQEVPQNVLDSFHRLIEKGYDQYNYSDEHVYNLAAYTKGEDGRQ